MIELRPFSENEYQTLISWIPDESALVMCSGKDFRFPLDKQQLDIYKDRKDLVIFSAYENGNHIGHADIVINAPVGRLCRIILDPALRGKGIGKKFIAALTEAGLQIPGIETITLNVMHDNLPALHCYEASGFEKVPGEFFSFEYSGTLYSGFLMKYMNQPVKKVNLAEQFAKITTYWDPHIAGELNGQHVRLAKLHGEFTWHSHAEEDELFFVVEGTLCIQLRDKDIYLSEGEFVIIPRGTEHRPVAENEVKVLLFEPAATLNTGNQNNNFTKENLKTLG